jgi:ankyrin repeat protein
MNRDILNIIFNDVLYNDINSIKKTSLICKNIHNNIQILAQTDEIKSKLSILQKYSDPNECMSYAASRGYHDVVDIVLLMFEKGGQRNIGWNLAMCNAARGGHMNIVQLMIEKGANWWNWTLYKAARGGHMDIVQLMIEKGADHCNEAMVAAARCGHIDIVQLMIDKGALRSAQQRMDWNGAMAAAARGGHHYVADIIQLMIEKGANDWNKAMYYAAGGGRMDIVLFMIEKGACNWDTTLVAAAECGHMDIVQLMIEKGAHHSMARALNNAAKSGHMNIVQFMIEKCAQRSIDWEWTIERYGHHYVADIIELLKQHQSKKFD